MCVEFNELYEGIPYYKSRQVKHRNFEDVRDIMINMYEREIKKLQDELVIFDTYSELTTFEQQKNSFAAALGANDDLVMSLVIFAWATTQQYFKEIVNHDIRKQIQLEQMNQMDEDVLPAPIIDDGLEHDFEIIGGDMWELADGGETYAKFMRNRLERL